MIAAAVLTVTSLLLAGGLAGVASADSHTTVDSCTTINESGTYTLTSDVETSETGSCFDVQAYPVTIDGDGHTISGPGSDTDSSGVSLDGGSSDDFTMQDATVDGFGTGIDATYGPSGRITLQGVTATGNGVGVDADYVAADIHVTESRVDSNAEVGFTATSSGPITVDATTFDGNGGTGFQTSESSGVTMTAVEISGNDGSGMVGGGRGDTYTIEDTSITDNSKHGIRAFSNAIHLDVSGSTLAGNGETDLHSDIRTSLANVQVGDATVDVEDEEELDATAVPQRDLPADSDDRTFDDGVALSRLDGSADVTLPSGSHDSLDVLRYADGWTTYEAALQPTDGAVSVTVQDDGTYALGERADEETATATSTSTATDTPTPEATATQTPESSTTAEADAGIASSSSDAETETAMPAETDRDTSGGSGVASSSSTDETPTGTEEQSTPVTVTGTDDSTASSSETPQDDTGSADESGETTDTATEESVNSPEEATGDGPGLGGLAALVALAGTALLLSTRRRRE